MAKCRRLKQPEGPGMVFVDYLRLFTSGKRVESDQREVSELLRDEARGQGAAGRASAE
ncbi:DnaB-like helicase C-terminal domain-containing protein [Microbacterium testaceum]|uniref:DnaB-like helicase C-terminal domain-containing protein n=1 Tax=Microbacterium testaceum TaxID=2033 RepID=UPI003D15F732